MAAVDAPVTKSDLDAAVERLEALIERSEGRLRSEVERSEERLRSEIERSEERMERRIAQAELRLVRQISIYLGGLSIALVSALAAAIVAVVFGG